MVTISFAITVCHEYIELEKLLTILVSNRKSGDEIVILKDSGNVSEQVDKVIEQYKSQLLEDQFSVYSNPLNKNFAAHKNYLFDRCSRNYIAQFDADEYPVKTLLDNIHMIIEANPDVELFRVPRINIVNNIQPCHLKQWGWNLNDRGFVNFPDYQDRIIKNNKTIRWVNPVHERLFGYSTFVELPAREDFCLMHIKELKKQQQQNSFYETIQ